MNYNGGRELTVTDLVWPSNREEFERLIVHDHVLHGLAVFGGITMILTYKKAPKIFNV